MLWFGALSYGAAALGYGAVSVIFIARRFHPARTKPFLVAGVASSLWAAGSALSVFAAPLPSVALIGLDVIHLFVWTVCALSLLAPRSVGKWLLVASGGFGLVAIAAAWAGGVPKLGDWATYPALVVMALIAFLAVEQVYRNAQEDIRRRVRLLCFAIGAIAATDLFVYSHATLLGAPLPLFWSARGFVNAAVLPLIVLGVREQSTRERELFVSRHVMFYTASLLGVGAYLIAMGAVAYAIRAVGGEWSFPLDLVFLTVGVAVLAAVLFSASIRARLRVFIVKHFYRSKYDYREAWLRLTQSLSRTGDLRRSAANGLEGMARIIGSESGGLWIERDGQRYELLVSLGEMPSAPAHYERDHALVKLLSSIGWVVDSEEYALEPDRYGTAFGHPDEGVLPPSSLVVPLSRQGYLQGFVVLGKPAGLRSLNFEDHDILKTAGQQVAAVLAQALVQEKLAEAGQFEALNRLSAFLMHDLKNIVAQQDLVVANAQRLKHRADFIDDAFMTIRGGTERIKKVLAQLASASQTTLAPGRVDASKVVMEVRSQCADREPIPKIELPSEATWVHMSRDELTSVLFHLVRNAQDATPPEGRITIGLSRGASELVITVADTGCGMDAEFVRDRLFRPFDSTKGAEGMGIGAYQARHIVHRAGGELDVTSERGAGTTFTVRLPAAS